MPTTPVQTVVRSILNGSVTMPADDVIRKARDQGVTASDSSIRDAVYNVKSELRKAAKSGGKTSPKPTSAKPASPKPVPAAARATKAVVPTVPAPLTAPGLDLSAVLANVALVNAVVGACGGPEQARKVAEAVKACGSVEAFLQHLDLVAQVRG